MRFLATPGGEMFGLYMLCLLALAVWHFEPEIAKYLLSSVIGAITMRMNTRAPKPEEKEEQTK